MCYTGARGGARVDKVVGDFYRLPNMEEYAQINLLSLSENCAVLEEQVYEILKTLPQEQQQVIEAYIRTRDDLEVETMKAALRWGKQHYK